MRRCDRRRDHRKLEGAEDLLRFNFAVEVRPRDGAVDGATVEATLWATVIERFFFQAEDGIRDVERSRGLGDVYKRQN